MDGYSSLQEFISALPTQSESRGSNSMLSKYLANPPPLSSPTKDRIDFDQIGHRKKLLRYRAAGKLAAAVREVEET